MRGFCYDVLDNQFDFYGQTRTPNREIVCSTGGDKGNDRGRDNEVDCKGSDRNAPHALPGKAKGGSPEMIKAAHLREYVIRPTLDAMSRVKDDKGKKVWSTINGQAAVNLLLGTIFQESVIGGETYLKQRGGGEGLGVYQIEEATHNDIWRRYLAFRPERASFVRGLARQHISTQEEFRDELIHNLAYATAIARIKYWRRRFTWPDDPNDIKALAEIWNTHYNANPDHGFPEDFIEAYPR